VGPGTGADVLIGMSPIAVAGALSALCRSEEPDSSAGITQAPVSDVARTRTGRLRATRTPFINNASRIIKAAETWSEWRR
jgi:hypothetical protein